MSEAMSEDRLAEIEALCNRATGGPWELHMLGSPKAHAYRIRSLSAPSNEGCTNPTKPASICHIQFSQPVRKETPAMRRAKPNFRFIAHSRTFLPECVAEIRRLRTLCEQYGVNYDQEGP